MPAGRTLMAMALVALSAGPAGPRRVHAQSAVRTQTSATRQSSAPPTSRHFHLQPLAAGVWAAINNDDGGWLICNAGIVDLGDRTVVIDPGMTPAAARDLKAVAEALTGRTVTLVVNTHWHNDHVRGNQVFVPGAQIVGTARTRQDVLEQEPLVIADEKTSAPGRLRGLEAQLATGATAGAAADARLFIPYYRGMLESHAELVATPPTIVADHNLTVHGTARRLEVRVTGPGHTTSDAVAFLPDERIAFPGDLVFVKRHPFLPDGQPEGWKQALRTIAGWQPMTVVPGHGPVSGPESVATMLGYIEALEQLAADGRASGKSPETVAATPVPAPYADWFFRMFYSANLGFLAARTGAP